MSRSTLVPTLIVCLGLTFAAVANTNQDAAAPAVDSHRDKAPTAADFRALVQRIEKLESQLSAPKEQEQLGRGFLAIEPIVANLDEGGLTRYIRIVPVLAVEDGQKQLAVEALSQISPQINNWLIATFSGKSLEDVRGHDRQQQLRTEIQSGINSLFMSGGYPEFAKAVLFDEFIIQ